MNNEEVKNLFSKAIREKDRDFLKTEDLILEKIYTFKKLNFLSTKYGRKLSGISEEGISLSLPNKNFKRHILSNNHKKKLISNCTSDDGIK